MNKFKTIISFLLIVSTLFLTTSCTNQKTLSIKNENGEIETYTFEEYGFFDYKEKKNSKVKYELSVGNVIWSIVLCETIIVPIILMGFYAYEPVGIQPEVYIK